MSMLIYRNGLPIAEILDTKFYYKIILQTANHEKKNVFENADIALCIRYLDQRFDGDWSFILHGR